MEGSGFESSREVPRYKELDRESEWEAKLDKLIDMHGERRVLDRRQSQRHRNIALASALISMAALLGSCGTTFAQRLGWRAMGPPDAIVEMRKEIEQIKQAQEVLDDDRNLTRVQVNALIATKCYESDAAGRRLLLAYGVRCGEYLDPNVR